ncbi:hypothetical protein V500_04001 [Pseudogymnoascus sp. VKM F-4518 (FW-2643)]|nr:hypothetical protein V500_04001 [Pseudogymnoascus sp. VKM F-4518 (FW-2643)]
MESELIERKVWSAIDAKFTLEYELDKPEKEETAEAAAVSIELGDRPSDSRKVSRLLAIIRSRSGKYDIASAQIRAARITDYQDIIDQFVDIEEQIKALKPVTESARQASTDTGNTRGKGSGRGGGGKSS